LKEKHKWPDGSTVLVPAVTFCATLNVVTQNKLTPFIVDANPYLWKARLESCGIPENSVAMIPVHLFGLLSPMQELMQFARQRNLVVLEDSCEMVGETAGSWGAAAAFSTYQCHPITTGVGGLAVTDDDELHEIMRSLANHGRDTAYLPGYRTPPITSDLLELRFRFVREGYSSRATEFEAALGLGQLERFAENLAKRRKIAKRLISGLFSFWSDLQVWDSPKHTYMMFPMVIKEGSHAKKCDLVLFLERSGIETRDMMPILNQPIFQQFVIPQKTTRYMADHITRNGFYVPVHPQMSVCDAQHIVDTIGKYLTSL
jgi:dTDP-4-amino-4,6-dideoxygalactose transaminase